MYSVILRKAGRLQSKYFDFRKKEFRLRDKLAIKTAQQPTSQQPKPHAKQNHNPLTTPLHAKRLRCTIPYCPKMAKSGGSRGGAKSVTTATRSFMALLNQYKAEEATNARTGREANAKLATTAGGGVTGGPPTKAKGNLQPNKSDSTQNHGTFSGLFSILVTNISAALRLKLSLTPTIKTTTIITAKKGALRGESKRQEGDTRKLS